MKRKIVSALLVMSMAASLVACGNSGSGSSDPADESVSVSSSASSKVMQAHLQAVSEAEAEESEMPEGYDETSTELYNEALGDFNDALATAKEAETVDERYALMAVAEEN